MAETLLRPAYRRIALVLLALATCTLASLSFTFFRWRSMDWASLTPKVEDLGAVNNRLLAAYAYLVIMLGIVPSLWLLRRTDLRRSVPVVWVGTFIAVTLAESYRPHHGTLLLPIAGLAMLIGAACARPLRRV